MSHPAIPRRHSNRIRRSLGSRIFDVCNVIFMFLFMWLGLGVYGVMIVTVLYTLIVCILNAMSLRNLLNYRMELRKGYLYPVLSAAGMGVLVAAIYWIPSLLLPDVMGRYVISAAITAAAVIVGVLVYMILYLKISKMPPEEIKKLPMGTKILRVARMLHLV